MNKNEESKKIEQLDPETRIFIVLEKVGEKLAEISKALIQLEALTSKLAQAVDIITKDFGILYVKRINDELHSKDE